ncbi:MAG: ABC transporter permease [Oscillospiraceae bacterium]|nr:ABC transporter permease [Oscillospiraceae bacterium]
MWKTIVRRILILIPQMFVLSVFLFLLAERMPGDALTGMIDPTTTRPERLEELRHQYGFYDPWHVKYTRWIGNAVRGDFGRSFYHKLPVTRIIADRAANTFWLGLLTVLLIYLIAIPLGITSGRFHDKPPDRAISFYSYFAMATPTIVLALFLIPLFAFRLGWFPFGGSVDPRAFSQGGIHYFLSRLHHMLLPAMTAALVSTAYIIQYLRSEIVDYEQSDFVTTARSKGVPQRQIYSRHIFRNALIPVASFVGYSITGVLSGSVLLETIYSYPGMGELFVSSITLRDYPVANALILLFAVLVVTGTLLSDIILRIVDPRLKIK